MSSRSPSRSPWRNRTKKIASTPTNEAMPPNKKVNTKVAAANERKAAVQKERDARARERQEADLAEVWSFGANGRQKARAEQNDQKRQQAEAKKAELKRLKEQEEAELSSMRPARGAARKAMMKSGGPKPTRTSFLSPLQPSEDVKENNREAPVPMEPNRNLIDDGFVEGTMNDGGHLYYNLMRLSCQCMVSTRLLIRCSYRGRRSLTATLNEERKRSAVGTVCHAALL